MSVAALLERQTFARRRIRQRLLDVVGRVWTGMDGWKDADVEEFLRRVVPLVEAGQLQMSSLTDLYIADVLSEMTGGRVTPIGLPRESATAFRPAPPEDVYRRPFVAIWTALSRGEEFERGVQVGRDRLLRLVEDDLDLAHRHTARTAFQAHGVTRFRRVIRPELARTGTCGLCIAAADQTYKSEHLLPIHTRCGCDVLPIVGSKDPGRTFNDEDTEALYRRAAREAGGSAKAADLSKVRFQVNEHGELGPVLRQHGARFTGPDDVAA